jgi:hypothetical protein
MIIFAVVVSIVAVLFVLLPLLFGQGGQLASASSLNSPERLKAVKRALLMRYIEDEKAYESKAIPKLVWDQRKQFLVNRYIDAARRLDYINDVIAHQAATQSKTEGV